MEGFRSAIWVMSRMIWLKKLSGPTFVTRAWRAPSRFKVPPITGSRMVLVTGTDSPVKLDSSTLAIPSRTSPSSGMRSPGRTTTVSPTITSLVSTSTG
jgi:hypothetical protein